MLPTPADNLEQEFARARWFHSIDFGEFASSGRFRPGSPQNITLYGFMDLVKDIDLKGMTVLDIGAMDGLASFGMRALGAKPVHATDSVDAANFRRSRDVLGLDDIHYHPKTQIKDFTEIFSPGQFDLILCAGVIYHMLNPASAFVACRKLIKDGGLFIVETPYFKAEDRAAIFVNSETEMVAETFTYSVPTKAAVIGLMKLVGFNVLAIRYLTSPHRITVLAKAVAPKDVEGRTGLLQRIHETGFCDKEFRLNRDLPQNHSSIRFSGAPKEVEINSATYQPAFPYHPDQRKRSVGTTQWATPDGNK